MKNRSLSEQVEDLEYMVDEYNRLYYEQKEANLKLKCMMRDIWVLVGMDETAPIDYRLLMRRLDSLLDIEKSNDG